jgi:hypothetical protein
MIRVQTCNIPCNKLLLLLKTNNIPLRGNKDVIQCSHASAFVETKQADLPHRGTKHVIYLSTEFLSVAKSKTE